MNVMRLAPTGPSRRVLITGGCGFLGCNIAAELAARGNDVVIADNLARRGARENAEWLLQRHGDHIAVEVTDIRDESGLCPLVAGADAVMHLAAQVAVTTSLQDPLEDFEINARGTLNVLEAVRRHNPDAPVIMASTNKVYGKLLEEQHVRRSDGRYEPADKRLAQGVSEHAALDFHSPYGCSKGTADQYVHDYARVFGLRTLVLRMSCIYGPRQFGNEDQGWIAHFLLRALNDQPITIYGDGYQVRDALFVDDAVDAWLRALDRIDDIGGRIFNLGGGPSNAVSLREMLSLIGEMLGRPADVRYADWRPGDQPWYVSNIDTIAQALAWKPQVPLPDGLRALAHWLDQRPRDFAPAAPAWEMRA